MPLIRDVVKALVDPGREAGTRTLLREKLASRSKVDLKELLFSVPLEGIDVERPLDFGREINR